MKSKIFVLLTTCLLIFSSCTPSTSDAFTMHELTADDNGIHWDAVKNATKYSVVVNEEEAIEVENTVYEFETYEGKYNVKVTAIDDNGNQSNTVSFSYETVTTSLESASITDDVISWGKYVGKGIELLRKTDAPIFVEAATSYTVNKSGFYTVRAATGYKDHKFYIENSDKNSCEKVVFASVDSDTPVVIEDGSEEDQVSLQEQYIAQRYVTNSWVDTTSYVCLDNANDGISENNCVKANFYHHGIWFKFTKDVVIDNRYDTLSFKIKGGKSTTASLSFEITDHIFIGSMDLAGVSISYQMSEVETQWVNCVVSLDDPDWAVDFGGKKLKFEEVKEIINVDGFVFNSIADLMPLFNKFSFRCYGPYDDDGTKATLWFDDVELSNVGGETSSFRPINLGKYYVIDSDAMSGNAIFGKNGSATLNVTLKQNSNKIELPVSYEILDAGIKLTCTAEGYDFVATFKTENNGNDFNLKEATGTASNVFSNFVASKYTMLDDFDDYTETGVGYDNNNRDPNDRSGLRGNYISDFYSSSTDYAESPLDSKWKLMDSNDYLDLMTDGTGVGGTQCGRFKQKSGNAMRYASYGLTDGTAKPFFGKYFSFFVKGSEDYDINIKIRVFSIGKLDATTATSDSVSKSKMYTLEANTDWHEVTIELDETIPYYGFSITPQTDSNGSSTFFYVDNINVYGAINPWGI